MGLSLYVYFWLCVDRKSKISLNLCTQFLTFKSLKCSDSPWKKNSSKKLAWNSDLWWLDENKHSWICKFIKLQISVFYCDLFILFAVYSEWTTIQGYIFIHVAENERAAVTSKSREKNAAFLAEKFKIEKGGSVWNRIINIWGSAPLCYTYAGIFNYFSWLDIFWGPCRSIADMLW